MKGVDVGKNPSLPKLVKDSTSFFGGETKRIPCSSCLSELTISSPLISSSLASPVDVNDYCLLLIIQLEFENMG